MATKFIYTKELAQRRATERGITVVGRGYNKFSGRRILTVRSQSEEGALHTLTHTPWGFECDKTCEGYTFYHMCVHLGAVHNHLEKLTQDERRVLLALTPLVDQTTTTRAAVTEAQRLVAPVSQEEWAPSETEQRLEKLGMMRGARR